ncbi:hypothetical protein ZWY2020_035000 [Hordeum vulgare]|nr:hypothetical protein ZWY2020_035000 [Hordeum vulgare]
MQKDFSSFADSWMRKLKQHRSSAYSFVKVAVRHRVLPSKSELDMASKGNAGDRVERGGAKRRGVGHGGSSARGLAFYSQREAGGQAGVNADHLHRSSSSSSLSPQQSRAENTHSLSTILAPTPVRGHNDSSTYLGMDRLFSLPQIDSSSTSINVV